MAGPYSSLYPALTQNMTMYAAVTCQMAVLSHDSLRFWMKT